MSGQVELAFRRLPHRLRAEVVGVVRSRGPRRTASKMAPGALRLARPGMQPSLAHDPKATRSFDLRRSSRARCLVLRVADAAREERDVDGAVRHRLEVGVLGVHDGRPEDDLEALVDQSQDASSRLSTAMSQPPQAGGPVHGEAVRLVALMPGPPSEGPGSCPGSGMAVDVAGLHGRESARPARPVARPQPSGPSARTSSTMRAISSASRSPSAALAQTSCRRAGSMPSAATTRRSSWKRRRRLEVLLAVVAVAGPAAGDHDAVGAARRRP